MHSKPTTMDKILIYPPGGLRPILEAPIDTGAKISCRLMSEYCIEFQVNSLDVLPLTRGCYINYDGTIFYLKKDPAPEAFTDIDGYRYTLKFYGRQHLMENRIFRWMSGYNEEVTFDLTTTLEEYASLLVSNMNAYMGESYSIQWAYNAIPQDLTDETKSISFDGATCFEAISLIADAFEVEWWVDEFDVYEGVEKVRRIFVNFGKCSKGDYVDICEGEIVNRFPAAQRGEDSTFGTRFFVYGGTKNLPDDYCEDIESGATNHVSEKRLHLPNGVNYIDVVADLPNTQIIERAIILNDIFPKNTETITDVEVVSREIIEDEINDAYIIVCSDTVFHPSSMKIGTLGITFTSGALKGRSFDVYVDDTKDDELFNKRFEIISSVEGENGSSQVIIPNKYLKPEIGDTFVLTGIKLPEKSFTDAENELLKKGTELANKYYADTNVYNCSTNPVYCTKNAISFSLGQNVRLVGAHFGKDGRKSRVQGYEKLLYDPFRATYTIGDNRTYSRYNTLVSALKIDVGAINNNLHTLKTNGRVMSINTLSAMDRAESAANDVLASKDKIDVLGTQVTKLIGDDVGKSARTIATEVAIESIPTQVATAIQKVSLSSAPTLNAYNANVVYEWMVSVDKLTISLLHENSTDYDNVWVIRFGCQSGVVVDISPVVLWEGGEEPTFSSWGICELTFRKDSSRGVYLGSWKVYK